MPYRGEPSSATAHLNILKDPQVTAFLKGCSYVPNLESRTDEIRRRLVDVSPLVRPLHTGVKLASDGSQYESIIEARFPSVRVGFLKFANVIIANRSRWRSRCLALLYDTLVDLIRRTGSVVIRDGKEGITFKQGKKSPATTGRSQVPVRFVCPSSCSCSM